MTNSWDNSFDIKPVVADMYAMNIQMSKFEVERGNMRCKDRIPNVRYDADQKRIEYYNVEVSNDVFFVVNDTNKGAIERSKYHFRNKEKKNYRESVFCFE